MSTTQLIAATNWCDNFNKELYEKLLLIKKINKMEEKNENQPAFPPSSEYIRKLDQGFYEPSGCTKLEIFSLEIFKSNISSSEDSVDYIEKYLGLNKGEYSYGLHYDLYFSKKSIQQAKTLLSELLKERSK